MFDWNITTVSELTAIPYAQLNFQFWPHFKILKLRTESTTAELSPFLS